MVSSVEPGQQTAPPPVLGCGAACFASTVSSLGGGGKQGYRADRPRPNYAQARSAHAGPAPADPFAAHIPTLDLPVDLPGDGRSGVAADVRIAARAVQRDAAWGLLPALPPPPAGQGQLKPAFASASCGAFPDDRRRVHHAARESRFAPAVAIRRFAAFAAYARSVLAPGG